MVNSVVVVSKVILDVVIGSDVVGDVSMVFNEVVKEMVDGVEDVILVDVVLEFNSSIISKAWVTLIKPNPKSSSRPWSPRSSAVSCRIVRASVLFNVGS